MTNISSRVHCRNWMPFSPLRYSCNQNLIPLIPSTINLRALQCFLHTTIIKTLIDYDFVVNTKWKKCAGIRSRYRRRFAAQKTVFNDLRAQGAPLEEAKKQLGDLQKTLALVKGAGMEKEKKAEGSGGQRHADGKPKKKERLLLKTAKVKFRLFFLLSCTDWGLIYM